MPNLEEFQATSGKIDVSDRGAESFAQAGRRAGVAFDQLGRETEKTYDVYHGHQVDMDVSNTATAVSNADIQNRDRWTQFVNDPRALDHPELGQQVRDAYKQSLLDIASHATTDEGRRLGERLAAQKVDEFSERAAADMSHLAGAKWQQNYDQFTSNSTAQVIDDPSQLTRVLGDLQEYHEQVSPHNLSAEDRAHAMEAVEPGLQRVTLAAYMSGIHKGESQIAAGQPGVALDAVQKMIDGKVAWEHLPSSVQAEMQSEVDKARTQGQERFQRSQVFNDEQAKRDGDAEYAQIDAALEPYKVNGQTPPPDLQQAVSNFTAKRGRTNAEQAHGLNELLSTISDPTRDFEKQGGNVAKAAAMEQRILTGDRTADEAALNASLARGDFSIAQYKVMKGLIPPKGSEADPTMKQAMTSLNEHITELIAGLPQGQSRGTVAAILRTDLSETFQQWVAGDFKGDPSKAIDVMFSVNNPRNVLRIMSTYRGAVYQTDPSAYLKQNLRGFQSAGYGVAEGSVVSPITGPTQAAPQAPSTTLTPERMQELSKIAGGH